MRSLIVGAWVMFVLANAAWSQEAPAAITVGTAVAQRGATAYGQLTVPQGTRRARSLPFFGRSRIYVRTPGRFSGNRSQPAAPLRRNRSGRRRDGDARLSSRVSICAGPRSNAPRRGRVPRRTSGRTPAREPLAPPFFSRPASRGHERGRFRGAADDRRRDARSV
jgi:hypothetical protein